jgi:hypothetical protein
MRDPRFAVAPELFAQLLTPSTVIASPPFVIPAKAGIQ